MTNTHNDLAYGCLEWFGYGCCFLLMLLAFTMFGCPAQGAQPVLDEPICETVDLLEVNNFYAEDGRPTFAQVIFYDWTQEDGRYDVLSWRLLRKGEQYPQRDWSSGGWVTIFWDDTKLRKIKANAVRHTWTQYDPELLERDMLPKEMRRGLKGEYKTGPIRPNAAGEAAP